MRKIYIKGRPHPAEKEEDTGDEFSSGLPDEEPMNTRYDEEYAQALRSTPPRPLTFNMDFSAPGLDRTAVREGLSAALAGNMRNLTGSRTGRDPSRVGAQLNLVLTGTAVDYDFQHMVDVVALTYQLNGLSAGAETRVPRERRERSYEDVAATVREIAGQLANIVTDHLHARLVEAITSLLQDNTAALNQLRRR